VLGLEGIQPGQQHLPPQVRGHRQAQRPGDLGAALVQRLLAGRQRRQHAAGMGQVARAFLRQPHAAGGAHQQAQAQLALEPLHRAAGQGRGEVQPPGRGREAPGLGGLDEDLQIVDADHLLACEESI
jgi:hypothetical protein